MGKTFPIIMRSLIIIASVILATSAFPQYAPAQREGSNEPASHSPPKNAVRATRDPNYAPKKVLATRDPNYVPKNAPATRDPNYIKKANPTCDCSKIRQEVQAVPINTANLAPAQQEGKQPAPVKPLNNIVKATRDPNYCNCSNTEEVIEVFQVDYDSL